MCVHGGWVECEMQAYQLCLLQQSHDVWAMKALMDCHLTKAEQGYYNVTAECAAELGLDHATLERCAQSDAAVEMLQKQFLIGVDRGIIGTPSVFVNGNMSFGWYENRTVLLQDICDAYGGAKPRGCKTPLPPVLISARSNKSRCLLQDPARLG